jgi:hypothetical protein
MFCRIVAFDMVCVMRYRPTTTEKLEGANKKQSVRRTMS